MFCEKCGTQLPDTALFCTNCGTNVSTISATNQPTEKVIDTDVQLQVKPTFNFGYMLLPSLIIGIVVILIFTLSFLAISPKVGFIMGLISCGIWGVIIGIKTIINKKKYDHFSYDFYQTKVIYKDSFLNVSEKEVKYKYIREVTMRQTFIQRFFNLGNIILYTNAETGFGNGINIINVENIAEVYQKIKSIIDE